MCSVGGESLGHNFSRVAVHAQRTSRNASGQIMLEASDQKMSVTDFAESFNGIYIRVTPSKIDFPDPWVAPNGFRWLQTIITNTPLGQPGKAPKAPRSVDPGTGPEPFYYDQPPSQKEPGDFDDVPNRGVPGPGQRVVWDATLTLVGLDRKEKKLTPYDIRTYGFRAALMPGTTGVSQVQLVSPKQEWSALGDHRTIVQAAYSDWKVSTPPPP